MTSTLPFPSTALRLLQALAVRLRQAPSTLAVSQHQHERGGHAIQEPMGSARTSVLAAQHQQCSALCGRAPPCSLRPHAGPVLQKQARAAIPPWGVHGFNQWGYRLTAGERCGGSACTLWTSGQQYNAWGSRAISPEQYRQCSCPGWLGRASHQAGQCPPPQLTGAPHGARGSARTCMAG